MTNVYTALGSVLSDSIVIERYRYNGWLYAYVSGVNRDPVDWIEYVPGPQLVEHEDDLYWQFYEGTQIRITNGGTVMLTVARP